MTQPTYCLQPPEGLRSEPGSRCWRVGCVDKNGPRWVGVSCEYAHSDSNWATELRTALDDFGYRGQGVVLALPSSLCLPVTIPAARRPKRQTPQTLAFAAEPELPIEAEALTTTEASQQSSRGDLLTVSVETETIQPVINALEKLGVAIESIAPGAWLAAASAFDHQTDWVLVSNPYGVDGFELVDGKPVAWFFYAGTECASDTDPTNISEAQARSLLSIPLKRWSLRHTQTPTIEFLDAGTAEQRLLEGAADQLAGKSRHTPNLRTGPLATQDRLRSIRTPLNAALLAILLLLITSSYQAWQHGNQQQQIVAAQKHAQQDAFRQALPGQAIPLAVRARLLSERNRLRVQAGIQEPDESQTSAWLQLDSILSHLPKDIRFRVHEVRVDEARALLEGEARTHSDADRIAASLRRGGLTVEPPRVSRLDDRQGVRFSLQLTASPPSLAEGRRP